MHGLITNSKDKMNDIEHYHNNLKEAVEKKFGKKPCNNAYFTELSDMIFESCKELLSATTLKRLWGYLKNEATCPQKRSLNILSAFVGFRNWQDFCNYVDNDNDSSSGFIHHSSLHSFLMPPGERIKICWYPNRSVVLEHDGDGDLFCVVESENSKLRPGMTLHCNTFTKKEILCLRNVMGCGITTPCDYVCGKIDGIDFEVINTNKELKD